MKSGPFQGKSIRKLGPADVRFTRSKANTVTYAIVLGWPGKEAVVRALGTASPQSPGKIVRVELLGHGGKVRFRQEAAALRVHLPAEKLSDDAIALKVSLA